MSNEQTAVVLLKMALEKGLGRKNLTSASITGGYLFYRLKQTTYAVNIASLEVFKAIDEEDGTRLFVDDYSMMTQDYLMRLLNDEEEVMRLADQFLERRK